MAHWGRLTATATGSRLSLIGQQQGGQVLGVALGTVEIFIFHPTDHQKGGSSTRSVGSGLMRKCHPCPHPRFEPPLTFICPKRCMSAECSKSFLYPRGFVKHQVNPDVHFMVRARGDLVSRGLFEHVRTRIT